MLWRSASCAVKTFVDLPAQQWLPPAHSFLRAKRLLLCVLRPRCSLKPFGTVAHEHVVLTPLPASAAVATACGSTGSAGTAAEQACSNITVNSTGDLDCPAACTTAFQQVPAAYFSPGMLALHHRKCCCLNCLRG